MTKHRSKFIDIEASSASEYDDQSEDVDLDIDMSESEDHDNIHTRHKKQKTLKRTKTKTKSKKKTKTSKHRLIEEEASSVFEESDFEESDFDKRAVHGRRIDQRAFQQRLEEKYGQVKATHENENEEEFEESSVREVVMDQSALVPTKESPRLWIVRVLRGKEKEVALKIVRNVYNKMKEQRMVIKEEDYNNYENDNLNRYENINNSIKDTNNINRYENNYAKNNANNNTNIYAANEEYNEVILKNKDILINDNNNNSSFIPNDIFSVVVKPDLHGYIYVESFSKNSVVEALGQIRQASRIRISAVEQSEMIDCLKSRKIEELSSYARIKKGKYKDDIAEILEVISSEVVRVRLVPRLIGNKRELFDSKKFKQEEIVFRVLDGRKVCIYRRDTFFNGFLEKEMLISNLAFEDISFEETRIFNSQITINEGDKIKVRKGDLKGLTGIVQSVERNELVVKTDKTHHRLSLMDVEKFFEAGDEVMIDSEKCVVIGQDKENSKMYFVVNLSARTEKRVNIEECKPVNNKPVYKAIKMQRPRVIKDYLFNKKVQLMTGQYKGFFGVVKDVYKNELRVLLDANMKYVNVSKESVKLEEIRVREGVGERIGERTGGLYGKTPGYKLDMGKTPGYSMDRGKTPGYSMDRGKTPGYSMDMGRTPGYKLDQGRTPGYKLDHKTDQTGRTPGYSMDMTKTPGYTHNTGRTPGYKLDQTGRTPSYNLDKGRTPGYKLDMGKTPGYSMDQEKRSMAGRTPGYKLDQGKTPGYSMDRGRTPGYHNYDFQEESNTKTDFNDNNMNNKDNNSNINYNKDNINNNTSKPRVSYHTNKAYNGAILLFRNEEHIVVAKENNRFETNKGFVYDDDSYTYKCPERLDRVIVMESDFRGLRGVLVNVERDMGRVRGEQGESVVVDMFKLTKMHCE